MAEEKGLDGRREGPPAWSEVDSPSMGPREGDIETCRLACSQMVMEAALAGEMITTERMVDLQGIHVNVKPYASRLMELTVRIHTDSITTVLAGKLAYPVIIGSDWSSF